MTLTGSRPLDQGGDTNAHTPGPWQLSPNWKADPRAIVDTQNVYGPPHIGVVAHVVMIAQNDAYRAERAANARLIAAAPDLLAGVLALKAASNFADDGNDVQAMLEYGRAWEILNAAITKAEGASAGPPERSEAAP